MLLRDQVLLACTLALVLAGLCAVWYRHRGDESVSPGYARWCFVLSAVCAVVLWYPRLDVDARTQIGFVFAAFFVVIMAMLAAIGAAMRQDVYDDLRLAWWRWRCRRQDRRAAHQTPPAARVRRPG